MFKKYISFYRDIKNQKQYAKWIHNHTKGYYGKIFTMTLLESVIAIIEVLSAIAVKNVIDTATQGKDVILSLGIVAIMSIVTLLLGAIYSVVSVVISEKYSFSIRQKVYKGVLNTCCEDLGKYHSGELMTRLTSDVNIVASGVSELISMIVVLVVRLCAAFITLFYYDWALALFTLIIAPITALISVWLGKKLRYLQNKVQRSEEKYRSFMQESIANQLIVKAFCMQDNFSDKLNELRTQRLNWVLKKNKLSVIANATMSAAYAFIYLVAFTWGAIKLSMGLISYGTLTVFLTLVNQIQDPLVGLAKEFPQIITVLASAGRIIEIENLEKEKYLEDDLEPEKISIDVSDLSFGYTKEMVLNNMNVQIKAGEFVAIIGKSGIGKTTLIRLIMNYLNPYEGSIVLNDGKGNFIESNAGVRQYISYVPQGNTLFSGTIEENIRMGRPDATEEEIEEALKAACAYEFVKELENGLQTVLGERGFGLSEGQAQRIAIARALIRKSPLLILDEATSALDEKTELKVLESIEKLEPKPTCLLITHRRSVLRFCDRELVITDSKETLDSIE